MSQMTPIENVRYDLAGADKARQQANRFQQLADALRYKGHFAMSVRFRVSWDWVFGGRGDREINLNENDCYQLQSWFAEKAQAELRRAAAYEDQALRDAGKEVPQIQPYSPRNPNAISARVSDFMEDPVAEVAREVDARG